MVTSTKNAEHYTWGELCDGWHLLKSDKLSVIEEQMPPGTSEQLHYHNKAEQVFYILSGTAQFMLAGEMVEVKAHESIHVSAGTLHSIANISVLPLRFLVISHPLAHGDRINIDDKTNN